jgi:hypothetical protein
VIGPGHLDGNGIDRNAIEIVGHGVSPPEKSKAPGAGPYILSDHPSQFAIAAPALRAIARTHSRVVKLDALPDHVLQEPTS